MVRAVEQCPFRIRVHRRDETEVAECRLLQLLTGNDPPSFPVRLDACRRCCRLTPPSLERMNSVIASLLYDAANRIIAAHRVSGSRIYRALKIQERVIRHLGMTPSGSQHAGMPEAVPRALAPRRLIDPQVTMDSYTEHLKRREPFGYLRYGDSEWISMLAMPNTAGATSGAHDFFFETLGRELRESLDYVAGRYPENRRLYVGLSTTAWYQDRARAYLQARRLADKVHWVDALLFRDGLRDFSTKRFLEAVRDFDGPKYLVANRRLGPVARGLGCVHVPIAERNCYLEISRAERACRFRGRGLILFCASMASECLIYRLHRWNPSATYVDCGHVFDAMVWEPTRRYTQNNTHGIMGFLKEHYGPMFPVSDAG